MSDKKQKWRESRWWRIQPGKIKVLSGYNKILEFSVEPAKSCPHVSQNQHTLLYTITQKTIFLLHPSPSHVFLRAFKSPS